MNQMSRIKNIFTNLRATNVDLLDGFYSKDVVFMDPLGEHRGIQSVKNYYKNLYKNVESIEFLFTDEITSAGNHLLVWTMNLKAKGLNAGKTVTVNGVPVIKFNESDLVYYHRDYFDMGEFVYERIPFLSWIIFKIKSILKTES